MARRAMTLWMVLAAAFAAYPALAQQPSAAEAEKPLLEINFNRSRVYFDRVLSQGVAEAEKTKPGGVMYDVVSYLPPPPEGSAASHDDRIKRQADEEIGGVVAGLRAQGVPPDRIRVIAMPYPEMPAGQKVPDYHKVAVFVK